MLKQNDNKNSWVLFLPIFYTLINLCAFSNKSFAEDFTLMAVCESPKGLRIDYGDILNFEKQKIQSTDQGFIHGKDGYSNMKPIFFITPDEPKTLHSVWGNAVPDNMKDIFKTDSKTEKNTIISKSNFAITATRHVQGTKGGTTWMITLHPEIGIGYFSSHSHVVKALDIKGNTHTDTANLAAKCTFSTP